MHNMLRLLSTSLLAASCSVAYAGFTDQTLLSVGLTVVDPDNDRGGVTADQSGFGARFDLSKKLSDRLVLSLQASTLEYDDNTGNKLNQTNAGLDLAVLLRQSGRLTPYVVAGVGYQRSDFDPSGDEAQNNYADIGLGFYHQLNAYGLLLKADARLRRDFFDDDSTGTTDYDDVVFNVGFSIPLGRQTQITEEVTPQRFSDEDSDGVDDSLDQCPNTEIGVAVDVNGCSDAQNGIVEEAPVPAPAPASFTPANQHSEYSIAFAPGSATPTSAGASTLDDIVKTLLHRRELIADISGGAGSGESPALAQERAQAMRTWLFKQGVSDDRLLIDSNSAASDNNLHGMVKLRID
jgi:OOP family OmpA-OmpF porin